MKRKEPGITRYDWKAGARGNTLEAAGSRSPQGLVFVRTDGGILGELYSLGMLTGQALTDAEIMIAKQEKGEKKQ